jgi:hypothetical protein
MNNAPLSLTERMVLLLVAIMLLTGFALFYSDLSAFTWYIKEDSLVEWLTVVGLLLGSVVCFKRFFLLFRKKSWWFLTVTFLLGLLLFVAAGEEISWGQRILGIESSEYFKENNAQGETNLHNLVINGVKINRLVFSTILSIFLAAYLLLIPILHRRNKKAKEFIDYSGIAVPALYQIIGFVLVFILTSLLRHDKSPELLECGAAFLFFLIIAYPENKYNFHN